MKGVLIIGIVIMIAVVAQHRIDASYQKGFADALKSAYKTNPPSDELEMTCLGLWLGEQNKKHYNKESRNAR